LESSLDIVALRAFLLTHVESYEQLEALRLLYRSGDGLAATDVASELKIETREAEQVLERLAKSKLAER
jgi:Mn-dependent DtxR family transcriptional regulator